MYTRSADLILYYVHSPTSSTTTKTEDDKTRDTADQATSTITLLPPPPPPPPHPTKLWVKGRIRITDVMGCCDLRSLIGSGATTSSLLSCLGRTNNNLEEFRSWRPPPSKLDRTLHFSLHTPHNYILSAPTSFFFFY